MSGRRWMQLLAAMMISSVVTAVALVVPPAGMPGIEDAVRWAQVHFGSPRATPLMYYATVSGGIALDKGQGGGNPFADGLIAVLRQKDLKLSEISLIVASVTQDFSKEVSSGKVRQFADVPRIEPRDDLVLAVGAGRSRRVALVVGLSRYSADVGSLDGVRFDVKRLEAALADAGFETTVRLDPSREEMHAALRKFSTSSATADVALVYMTGHGVELDGHTYLIPREFRRGDPEFRADADAFDVAGIADYLLARKANLVFFGGCRNKPSFIH